MNAIEAPREVCVDQHTSMVNIELGYKELDFVVDTKSAARNSSGSRTRAIALCLLCYQSLVLHPLPLSVSHLSPAPAANGDLAFELYYHKVGFSLAEVRGVVTKVVHWRKRVTLSMGSLWVGEV